MFVCGSCGIDVADAIQCSVCTKHYDFACSGISEKGYRKLGDRQAQWKCPACKISVNLNVKNVAKSASVSPVQSPSIAMDRIMQELANIKLQLAPLSSIVEDIQEVKKELADLKNVTSNFTARIGTLEDKIAKIEANQEDTSVLKAMVSKLEAKLDENEQWLRANNVEIKGVPAKDKENLLDLVLRIGSRINYTLNKNQINFVHRVPTNNSATKNVIVSFTNRYVKQDFLAAARFTNNNLKPDDIGLSGSGRIFVNDHLTIKTKMLLSKAKAKAKEHNFQFVWVKHAKIFVRRDPTSKAFVVKSDLDLAKIH